MSTTHRCWVGKSLVRALHTSTGGVRPSSERISYIVSPVYIANAVSHTNFLPQFNISREPQRVLMSREAHLRRKAVRSLNLGFLPTYLPTYLPPFFFVFGRCLLIPSGGSS